MNAAFTVIPDGRVYIDAARIVAVGPADAPSPPGMEDVPVVRTGGTIYPGLIELHNHLSYNALPLWALTERFENRGVWGGRPQYPSTRVAARRACSAARTVSFSRSCATSKRSASCPG